MKIAFDSQILFERQKTGIGRNSEAIISNYIQLGTDDIVLNYFRMLEENKREEVIDHYLSNHKVNINKCKWFHSVLYNRLNRYLRLPYKMFFREEADVTQFFNYVLPPGVKGKTALYVYDMAYKVYPETIGEKTLRMLNENLAESCRRADRIITISEFSKQEIIKYLGIPSEKIAVVPCAVDHSIYNNIIDLDELTVIKKKFNIDQDYFLYLGTLEPRKNIEKLIDAYAALHKRDTLIPKLVIAGKNGWNYDNVYKKVSDYKINENVIFTGYIEAEEAVTLLKGALAFVFPSIYEGFGMPPLEAMACGVPIITSNVSSLPEVVQDAGYLIDPFSAEDLSEAMFEIISNTEHRKRLIERGLKRAKEFTWKGSAERLRSVYENMQ
ncbi:glycosyltransferase family 1 protein [Lacrimispora amygdalina]|uniref:Glycosyltransferase family 1 protein n=1 Tax=Lacrimispora amygdalina TaxID=253257 RepID=A0A3E2N4R8_9FIRM|nr:glycosyltransferase family 1 protein [Clostridium indicum]RFZ75975.1 glycosyltransferase family 1 protein [Clostridium indicum]